MGTPDRQTPRQICSNTEIRRPQSQPQAQRASFCGSSATERIRSSLGVRFSDYFSLSEYNVGVEGQSDRSIFETIYFLLLDKGALNGANYPKLDKVKYLTFGGVRDLGAFLKTTYPMITRERAFVSVLDGDDAGMRTRQELQQFFGQKQVRFESGTDFISIRHGFAIEGLFPDQWIIDLHARSSQYFRSFSVDAQGELEPFSIYDNHKAASQNYLLERAKSEEAEVWSARFLNVFGALETSLSSQERLLGSRLSHSQYATAAASMTAER